jgi:hypothetical protein
MNVEDTQKGKPERNKETIGKNIKREKRKFQFVCLLILILM